MGKTKKIDVEVYDMLCDQVRHVSTEVKSLTVRIKKLEKYLNKLASGEEDKNGNQ